MIRSVEYFEKPGKANTSRCVEIVEKIVQEGFSHVVVATTNGDTALAMARKLRGQKVNIVAVTHNVGYQGPNVDECSAADQGRIENLGSQNVHGNDLDPGNRSSAYAETPRSLPGIRCGAVASIARTGN